MTCETTPPPFAADIRNCARCQGEHPKLLFFPLAGSPGETWASCPATGQPLILGSRATAPDAGPQYKIFVSLPHYGEIVADALPALMAPTDKHQFYVHRGTGSLLALNFNQLMAICLRSRAEHGWTHVAMMHSDVAPEPGWLDVLLDEMDRTNADIMSTILPIKDVRLLTSTGWMDKETGKITRLTMKQVLALPETFDAAGCGHPDAWLMVNTGLWVARLGDWVEKWRGFTICDSLWRDKEDGNKWKAGALPEDWHWSRWAQETGLRVFATRKPKARHFGRFAFGNDVVWEGALDTDPGDPPW